MAMGEMAVRSPLTIRIKGTLAGFGVGRESHHKQLVAWGGGVMKWSASTRKAMELDLEEVASKRTFFWARGKLQNSKTLSIFI